MIKPIKYYVYNNLTNFRFRNTIHRVLGKAIIKGNIPHIQMRKLMNMEWGTNIDINMEACTIITIKSQLTKYKKKL